MPRFIGRKQELKKLNELAAEPGAQFLILYGRRRIGKTTLLLHWAQESGLHFTYWVANRLSPALQLRSFSRALYNTEHPDTPANADFTYPTWEMALEQATRMATDQRFVLIMDEFPYVAEAEPGLPSVIQNMWDHHLKSSQVFLILAGSHVGMMTRLLDYQAPLYGRFTSHLLLKPLPFAATTEFLPRYTAAQRVATYAILGGIPAYLERFKDKVNLASNVKRNIFRSTGIFRVDPLFLLQDQVREPRNYLSILHAIGGEGKHTLDEISKASGLPKQNVSTYLKRLADIHLVERRAPVTLPANQRERSRQGRWHLLDSYLRFYFRFVVPNQRALELGLLDAVWSDMRDQFRSFVGVTTFEELCREWVVTQATSKQLPFAPHDVGSHWAADVQVDVIAINRREKQVLIGECKWITNRVSRSIIRELLDEKTPKTLQSLPKGGAEWTVHHAIFSRAGLTPAAQTLAQTHNTLQVDLETLVQGLREPFISN
jgi:AAA+ ATPase superfamily predicted ATPase